MAIKDKFFEIISELELPITVIPTPDILNQRIAEKVWSKWALIYNPYNCSDMVLELLRAGYGADHYDFTVHERPYGLITAVILSAATTAIACSVTRSNLMLKMYTMLPFFQKKYLKNSGIPVPDQALLFMFLFRATEYAMRRFIARHGDIPDRGQLVIQENDVKQGIPTGIVNVESFYLAGKSLLRYQDTHVDFSEAVLDFWQDRMSYQANQWKFASASFVLSTVISSAYFYAVSYKSAASKKHKATVALKDGIGVGLSGLILWPALSIYYFKGGKIIPLYFSGKLLQWLDKGIYTLLSRVFDVKPKLLERIFFSPQPASIIAGEVLSIGLAIIPLIFVAAGIYNADRTVTPQHVFQIAKKLKKDEQMLEVTSKNTEKTVLTRAFDYLPTKKTVFYGLLAGAAAFTFYAQPRYFGTAGFSIASSPKLR